MYNFTMLVDIQYFLLFHCLCRYRDCLVPRHVFGPFFVCFARSLMPVLPRFDLQLLVALLPLREYDDLSSIACVIIIIIIIIIIICGVGLSP
jgi:hypothetical protein